MSGDRLTVWTSEPPTREGYYWVRGAQSDPRTELARVQLYGGEFSSVHLFGWEDGEPLSSPYFVGATWFGPLEAPA
jgi:hypothetical protein